MCPITFLPAVIFTLTGSLCLFTVVKATCNEDGWFGPSCQYQCHCADYVPCNKENGFCSSGCDSGWFGPACQYASIGMTPHNWLTDNNDSTCNPGDQSAFLTLKQPIPLTWIRVVHKAKGNLQPLRIVYNYKHNDKGYQLCPNNQRVVVDENTVDFNCTISYKVRELQLEREGFKSLCSLYINGGRNVALKQITSQSSRFRDTWVTSSSFLPEYAVDGRLPDSTIQSAIETCSHTDENQTYNWWTVNFTQPVDVTRFLIHNRRDCCSERLEGFSLTASGDNYKNRTLNGPNRNLPLYNLVPNPKINFPVTQITIRSREKEALTLCEVQVFGEVHCPPGRFGLSCERQCHCVNQTRCFVHSGGCPAGCAPGYTGSTCSENQDLKVIIIIAAVVVFIVDVVVIITIASFFVCRRRGRKTREGEVEEPREEETGIKRDDHPQGTEGVDTQPVREATKESKRNSKQVERSPTSKCSCENESAELVELSTACTSEIKSVDGNTAGIGNTTGSGSTAGSGNTTGSGSTAVCVENLKNYILQHSNDSHFEEEFSSVPMTNSSPQTHGALPGNAKKNRYKNIIPYDASRVQLQTTAGKKQSDYINASYMQGYIDTRAFIASQGPMPAGLNDFVRMLWEQRVEKIVMLTNLVEEGKKKCSMYWPEDGKKQFDEIAVTLLTVHVFAEYTIRNLMLSKKGEPFRYITQFHFTAWPDKSVPESPWGLVDLYQRVTAVNGNGPVLVHCSAGVGRTGTFIGLCNLLQEAEVTGKMDFRSTLLTLRQCRMHSIQTLEQYIYLHHAALVGHVIAGTTIEVKDMYQRISSLEGEENGTTRNYEQEFEALVEVCDITTRKHNEAPVEEHRESVYPNAKNVTNISKDRLGNIVPHPSYRPNLYADSCHKDTYINAVLVPNLIKDHHDILTQLPLPSTVTDFWRLVTQYNVGLVVAFDTDLKETDESVADFFSTSVEERFENEGIVVETMSVVESKLVTELSLSVRQKTKKSRRSLTLLLCRSEESNPWSVHQLQEKICSHRPINSSRTVYMCRTGADKCGLICIQSILLERMKLDQCLCVPLVVGKIKSIRPQVIPTVEQYKCLYRVLELSRESQNVYFNVGERSGASVS